MTTFIHRIHDARARVDAAVLFAFALTALCLALAVGAGIAAAAAEPAAPTALPTNVDQPAASHAHGS